MDYTIVFDPESEISYGWWECPECGNKFYWGGRAMHKKGCSKTDYSGLIYHYSRKEMEGALKDYAPNSPHGFIKKIRHQ